MVLAFRVLGFWGSGVLGLRFEGLGFASSKAILRFATSRFVTASQASQDWQLATTKTCPNPLQPECCFGLQAHSRHNVPKRVAGWTPGAQKRSWLAACKRSAAAGKCVNRLIYTVRSPRRVRLTSGIILILTKN